MKSGGRAKHAFGAKKLENITPTSRTLTLTKRQNKENKDTKNVQNTATQELKKGFQLWFDENSQKISEEENIIEDEALTDHCLGVWKSMSKAEKEGYKTPRAPKRPREPESKTSTSAKLAKFSV